MTLIQMEFREIDYGDWFRDSDGPSFRRMIRIKPFGDPALLSRANEYFQLRVGFSSGAGYVTKEVNAIDDRGIICRCPNHVPFWVEVNETP